MEAPKRPASNFIATVVLLVTILIVTLSLRAGTDIHAALRTAISVGSGVLAASLTKATLDKRR